MRDKPIDELAKMLYKDLVKTGETPQNPLTKAIKAVSAELIRLWN